ncbi:glycosyltransferase family 2 protein [Polynucleobacter cosmopolitanus]|jgi:GT2 family glycosyltransferase|uniref:Glycosyl transferase n=1 Tax=Polynucleobacter cosmopolitanus TaxID=351345 RepID=A0A229FW28_9BURK|nr:glycosyltransferase [Polynucleobacter cosmopolitanus]OXL16207.1 glycosyl transferase [Polynucleobacter cosmopolitanus]
MNKNKYSLTFACYNSVEYTKLCVDSMIAHGTPLDRLVVVDNGSKDETRDYLSTLPLGGRIFNNQNLGCGVAWNQGALHLQSEWTIVMNNDVLVSPNWIENLIGAAESQNLKIVSPALIEGKLDYDFTSFEKEAQAKMKNEHRIGARHAVCLAIHESVWMDIGYFQPVPKLLGYEDTMFFHEAKKANLKMAMTGASWLHHYGSITQTAMKLERGLKENQNLPYRYNYRLLNQSWLERKMTKIRRKRQERTWRDEEVAKYGISMHGIRENTNFRWL